ncbi:STAS domain-containing protein [Geodermatophilus sp. URMC 64]
MESDNGSQVLRLVGDIDDAAIAAYETHHSALHAPVIDVVDLAGVTHLGSAGVGFLLRHTKNSRELGQPPALRGLARSARRVLDLTGVSSLFQLAA